MTDDPSNELREKLLQHYAEVDTAQHYFQIDGWVNKQRKIDAFIFPHRERYSVTGTTTDELWRSDCAIRLHIDQEASQADVLALLA